MSAQWNTSPVEEPVSREPSLKSWTGSEPASEAVSRSSTTRRPNGFGSLHNISRDPSQREPYRDSVRTLRRVSDASRIGLKEYPSPSNGEEYLKEDMLGGDDEETNFGSPTRADFSLPPPQRSPSQQWSLPPMSPFQEPRSSPFAPEATIPHDDSSMNSHRLVIAIDYGTTYTGIAFAMPNGDIAALDDIQLMQNWGTAMENDQKIPSVISYSPASRKGELQFGANISEEAVTMVNTKLELDVQDSRLSELESLIHALEGMENLKYSHVQRSRGTPGYTYKSPESVVRDYLARVFQAFFTYLKKQIPGYTAGVLDVMPVDIVITVPVKWSYEAKNATYRAVKSAGFNESNFLKLETITMVQEPVAATLYAVRFMREQDRDFLKPDDCFVLCDAGGGTVDVVAYRVESTTPKLKLKEIGMPTCQKCGSIYINANFKEWLRALIGPRLWAQLDPKSAKGRNNTLTSEGQWMREIMRRFDEAKKAFGKENRDISIRLEGPLRDITIRNSIREGLLHIPRKTMKSFFDPCIDRTVELILGQISQAEAEGTRVKNIIMVGGFAESPYLKAEIESSLRLRNITLHRPKTSWIAVVCGAVISGIENSDRGTPLKSCPKNYGICLTEDFSGIRDNWDDRYTDNPTSRVMATGQMHWLIMKGDLLEPNEGRTGRKDCPFTFSEHDSRNFKFNVFEYGANDAPQRFQSAAKELITVFTIDVDLSVIPLEHMHRSHNHGRPYYTASTTCQLSYTSNGQLEAQMLFDGKVVGSNKKDVRNVSNPFRREYE